MLGLPQTELARKLGVSFPAFNRWWTGKALPRAAKQAAIHELFLEVTGRKVIPPHRLVTKKKLLWGKSSQYKNVLDEILQHPDIRDQFILKLTYHSNRIEGSKLTESDTAAILFDNVALPDKSLTEQLEAKNHQTALMAVFDTVSKNRKIDEHFGLKLHGILMNGIRPNAGSYRHHSVRIVGVHLPTANFMKIPALMPPVMALAGKRAKDVIRLSATFHSQFEQIHPFSDGNGRVGRLLLCAMLLRANLAPAVIRQERKQLYYTYLYKAQMEADYSQLEDFLCEAVLEGFTILERADVA